VVCIFLSSISDHGVDGVLEIPPTASAEQIRQAYKKAALKWHPDRVPADSPERPKRTKKFQQINDAYYTLSDVTRRRDYDDARSWHTDTSTSPAGEERRPPPKTDGSFPWSAFGFSGTRESQEEKFANDQFGSAFEEMMGEAELSEDESGRKVPNRKFWSIVGGIAGASLGFIVGNYVGLIPGLIAGNRLGAIRDARGKSVYEVFQELDQNQKARLLSELAAKIFQGAVS